MQDPASIRSEELAELAVVGLATRDYRALRAVGASHAEVMEAFVLGADLAAYALFRTDRAHRRALDEAGAPDSPTHLEAGRLGVSDAELAEVRADHRGVVEAYWVGLTEAPGNVPSVPRVPSVADYLTARRAGLGHGDALAFARQVTSATPRPGSRDLVVWARCRAAGLGADDLFGGPAGRVRLAGTQLDVLYALLFARRAFEVPPIGIPEMLWVAARSGERTLDVHAYLELRAGQCSRRRALRRARRVVSARSVDGREPSGGRRRGRRSPR